VLDIRKANVLFFCTACLLFSGVLFGCGSSSAPGTGTQNPPVTTFTLSVINGYGSGTYAGGTVVDIFANPQPNGFAFNAWTGSTSYLADPGTWHTTATAAAGASITVTANNTLSAPAISPTVVQIPGTDTGATSNQVTTPSSPVVLDTGAYQIPAAHPAGIIFEFHGKGGSYTSWFSNWDKLYFNAEALAAGYGIVAINSAATGYWDSQTLYPNNLDVQNVQATIKYLEGLSIMSASDRIYGLGESDGGGFDAAVSRYLNFRATSLQIISGAEAAYDPSLNIPTVNGISHTLIPTIWELMQNDGTSGVTSPPPYPNPIGTGPTSIAQAYCNAVELQTLANPVAACNTNVTVNPYPNSFPNLNFYMNPPSPAYPARFAILGISASTAQTIDAWMQTQGCIDANGMILHDPYQSVDYSANPVTFNCSQTPLYKQFSAAPTSLTAAQASALEEQFLIAYAEHHFYSEYTDKVIAFFKAH
jgi:hypothetical protein